MGGENKYPNLKNREAISAGDLSEARDYIEYILKNNICKATDEKNKLILKAFNTAIITTYSKPFVKSWSSKENPADWFLPRDCIEFLTADEIKLHNEVIRRRDKEIAHSDSDAHSLKFYNGIPVGRDVSFPLQETEFIIIKQIIDKLLSKITPTISFNLGEAETHFRE